MEIDNYTTLCYLQETYTKIKNDLEYDTECSIVLITKYNLPQYVLPEHPLHPCYEYLSPTHRADYLRTYFMHFYGGGYSDIKIPTASWKKAFEDMEDEQNKHIYINGYPELEHYHLPGYVGNGEYIVRPNTEFTREWYNKLLNKMDEKIGKFRPDFVPDTAQEYDENNYPIRWEEILGEIFRTVLPNHMGKILYSVPVPDLYYWNYR
jgi:hypothetical protein